MSKVRIIQVSSGRYMLFTIHSQAITLAIFIVLFLSLQDVIGQNVGDPVRPIISVEPNPALPFYDRFDKVSRSRELIATSEFTSSFDWLVGVWTVNATGYAKNGFKRKKMFSWREPQREIFFDSHHTFYMTFRDSTVTIMTKDGKKSSPFLPQILLQYDKASQVWAFKGGYDWGSEIATGWIGNKIVFRGSISLAGLKINERQNWVKLSDKEFHITYEEQLRNGSWFVSETNIYKRVESN